METRSSKSSNRFYNDSQKVKRIDESKQINKSLFFLTQVIYLCAKQKKDVHIPFRNSPLTKLLRSSFGGKARTLLILCISPCERDFELSLSTMKFGQRAKKIKNKIKSNIITNYNNKALQDIIQGYERKIENLESRLKNEQQEKFELKN